MNYLAVLKTRILGGLDWVLCLRSYKFKIKVLAGADTDMEALGKKLLGKKLAQIVGRIQFFATGGRTEVPAGCLLGTTHNF